MTIILATFSNFYPLKLDNCLTWILCSIFKISYFCSDPSTLCCVNITPWLYPPPSRYWNVTYFQPKHPRVAINNIVFALLNETNHGPVHQLLQLDLRIRTAFFTHDDRLPHIVTGVPVVDGLTVWKMDWARRVQTLTVIGKGMNPSNFPQTIGKLAYGQVSGATLGASWLQVYFTYKKPRRTENWDVKPGHGADDDVASARDTTLNRLSWCFVYKSNPLPQNWTLMPLK